MDFNNEAAKGYLLIALRMIELGDFGNQPKLERLTREEKWTLLHALSAAFDEETVAHAEQYYFDY